MLAVNGRLLLLVVLLIPVVNAFAEQKAHSVQGSRHENGATPSADFWESFDVISDENLELDDLQVITSLHLADEKSGESDNKKMSESASSSYKNQSSVGVMKAGKRGE